MRIPSTSRPSPFSVHRGPSDPLIVRGALGARAVWRPPDITQNSSAPRSRRQRVLGEREACPGDSPDPDDSHDPTGTARRDPQRGDARWLCDRRIVPPRTPLAGHFSRLFALYARQAVVSSRTVPREPVARALGLGRALERDTILRHNGLVVGTIGSAIDVARRLPTTDPLATLARGVSTGAGDSSGTGEGP